MSNSQTSSESSPMDVNMVSFSQPGISTLNLVFPNVYIYI